MNLLFLVVFIYYFLYSFFEKFVCMLGYCYDIINKFLEPFDIIPGCINMKINNKDVYFTHGHVYNKRTWHKDNAILISGHTHIAEFTNIGKCTYINPGSISLPLGKEDASYMLITEKKCIVADINDQIIFEKDI